MRVRIAVITIVVAVTFFGGWALTYPSPDPKSIKYVLWKADLYKLNLEEATATMVGDRHRDELVVRKTKVQLRNKFGALLSPVEASPYLRGCYQNSSWKDRDVLFIRQSSWMVVFDADKATNLVLVKRVRRAELCDRRNGGPEQRESSSANPGSGRSPKTDSTTI